MEKPSKSSRGTIMLKYLQKAATFTLTNLPHSPRGGAADKRPTARGFSGPISSIIPANARLKKSGGISGVEEEPTSPKVTCIGQIKHKKKTSSTETTTRNQRQKNKAPSSGGRMARIFSQRVRPSGPKEKTKTAELPGLLADVAAAPPGLGRMRKYASGRETLSDFDWEKIAAAAESSDDEKDKEAGNIYHSAPLVLGGGAAVIDLKEKDASIWRRRAAFSAAALPELKLSH